MSEPVVIIGAGMAGLTLAAYLARAGKEVVIYEQHTLPGGYVSAFVRAGFTFPAGPTSFGSNGIVFPILEDLGIAAKRPFLPAAHQISWGQHDVPLRTPKQVQLDLADLFPADRRGLARYFRWVEIGGAGFRDMLESEMMFGKRVFPTILRLILRHPLFPWASLMARGQTNRSLHERYFSDPLLRQMLNQLGYPVMSGQNTLGMWTTYFHDTWVPAGGMQIFANRLVHFIRGHGGAVHLGVQVKRIRLKDGRAVGVLLGDGTEVPAAYVVSAADLRHTCVDLIGSAQLPPSMVTKLEKARPSESLFVVYLGLHDSPELADRMARFRESHVSYSCANGAHIRLVMLSKDDPSLAPTGKHALYVAKLTPYEDWEDVKGHEAAYRARKTAFAEEVIAAAEEFIPGLRAHIEVQEAASPLTFERYTSNWRGSTAGWNWNPETAPRINLEQDLPFERFYAIGHYVHSPGGVPTAMITAWYIAQEILKGI